MALTGSTIASTYLKLLRVNTDTMGADATASYIQDSADTDSALSISTTRIGIGTAAPAAALHTYAASGDAINKVETNSAGTAYIQLDGTQVSNAAVAGINFYNAGDTVAAITAERVDANDAADLYFRTQAAGGGNTERMRITSAGSVGIGTASPGEKLQVNGAIKTTGGIDVDTASSAAFGFQSGNARFISWGSDDSTKGGYSFQGYTSAAGSSSTYMNIASSGDVTFIGDLIMADGKGINFAAMTSPADAAGMTAEILDDYEEGTWDAVVSDGTNAMTMLGTHDTGYYTKVGNLVTVSGQFITTSLGSASGGIRITGLPFTVANSSAAYSGGAAAYGTGYAITAGNTVSFNADVNQTYIELRVWSLTTGTAAMQASEWTLDGGIMISFTYRAA